jgi:predicted ArsR family transcriptional regulator
MPLSTLQRAAKAEVMAQPTRRAICQHLFAEGEASVPDLTAALDLPKTTVYENLTTLSEEDIVTRIQHYPARTGQTQRMFYTLSPTGREVIDHIPSFHTST